MVGEDWLGRDSLLPEGRLLPLKVFLHLGVPRGDDVHGLNAVAAVALELPEEVRLVMAVLDLEGIVGENPGALHVDHVDNGETLRDPPDPVLQVDEDQLLQEDQVHLGRLETGLLHLVLGLGKLLQLIQAGKEEIFLGFENFLNLGDLGGRGNYFSEFPEKARTYSDDRKQLILCEILPGLSYSGPDLTWPSHNSKLVKPGAEGYSRMVIIEDHHQILPVAVIHL